MQENSRKTGQLLHGRFIDSGSVALPRHLRGDLRLDQGPEQFRRERTSSPSGVAVSPPAARPLAPGGDDTFSLPFVLIVRIGGICLIGWAVLALVVRFLP